MNYGYYTFIGFLVILTLCGIISYLFNKIKFLRLSDDYIEFSRFWFRTNLILKPNSIKEIFICTLQGKLTSYYIFDSKHGKIRIDPDKIEENTIKNFSIRNDITLMHEEGFHGGGINTLYKSKK